METSENNNTDSQMFRIYCYDNRNNRDQKKKKIHWPPQFN